MRDAGPSRARQSLLAMETGGRPEAVEAAPLYRMLAGEVRRLIEAGTFRPGERVPSVRALARNRRVSIATVLEAYRRLEDGGLIEARPQSGYFVRPRLLDAPEEPAPSAPDEKPKQVSMRQLTVRILKEPPDPARVGLGMAMPSREILPSVKLNRLLGRVARLPRQRPFESAQGSLELRSQIARRAILSGCALTPEEIVVTNGCQEAVFFALRATCRPGDTVAVESPTYLGFLQAIEDLGLKALEIRSDPREGICLDALDRALRRNAVRAALVVTSYSNPLGSCLPEAKRRDLVGLLARRHVPLIEDDIFGDLPHGLQRTKVARAFDRGGQVLLCSSFSKTLAPGYRVGWIAPGNYMESVIHQKIVTNLSGAVLPQLAMAAFLAEGGYDRHLRRARRIYAHQVALVTQAISDSFPPGTRVTRPAGGFLLWVEMPAKVDALRLYEKAIEAKISIAPGPLFSAKGGYRNFIRLSAGEWSERVARAVARVGQMARGMA